MAEAGGGDVQATLQAWRACGADRLDPVRFHFIAALARRADGQAGEARRLLERRLAGLIAAYGDDLARAAGGEGAAAHGAPMASAEPAPVRGALAELVAHVAGCRAETAARGADAPGAAYPELPMLDEFRERWARLSTDRQLRQSLEQVPENAGPLNSSHLAHRALEAMRALSPAYLQRFLAYVDALSWLERTNGGAAPAGKDAGRGDGARRSGRGVIPRI